jgi:magnesium transporter
MNEVMKVLTVIATIFCSVDFCGGHLRDELSARYIPELEQPWSYPAALILMLVAAMLMVGYFRRKKWN